MITVYDRVHFSAPVSFEQAAAYCRRHPKLAGWREARPSNAWVMFIRPDRSEYDERHRYGSVSIPACEIMSGQENWQEAIDELVRLGCGESPSAVLRAMSEVEP